MEVVDRKDPKKRWSGTVTQVGSLTAENTSNNNGGNKQQENPNQGKYPYTVELDQGGEMPLVGSHSYVNIVENAPEAGKVVVNKAYTFNKKWQDLCLEGRRQDSEVAGSQDQESF